MNCNEFVLKTVMIIPFALFLMVTFFEIPYRIFTTFNKKGCLVSNFIPDFLVIGVISDRLKTMLYKLLKQKS
jgi:hypothetical protein